MNPSSGAQFSMAYSPKNIKEKLFPKADPYTFVSPSAYDTAWLAMIPDYRKPVSQPLFGNCLKWVLNNQNEEGVWGDCTAHGSPSIDCLTGTLACLAVLAKWNVGHPNFKKGLDFIQTNAEFFAGEMNDCPRWFAIVFPGLIELINTFGIEFALPKSLEEPLRNISFIRGQILDKENIVDVDQYPPLLSYLEALPAGLKIDNEDITRHLDSDGSIFQSPAATACAYMITKKKECLNYLQNLVRRCPNGVPPTHPMDEDLIQLTMINHVIMLGLVEHFKEKTEEILAKVYRNYINHETATTERTLNSFVRELYKDSLAFRLLRIHGYNITSGVFCWLLRREDILNYLEKNHRYFPIVMLNIYRATNLTFKGECKLEEARSFSRSMIQKSLDSRTMSKSIYTMIAHELTVPWHARLDHLEHRIWIEYYDKYALWMGKTSPHRLSNLYNDKLVQFAKWTYENRQAVYKMELEELTRWSTNTGLNAVGFRHEKTTYCYFAIATSTSLPYDSNIRMIVAKSAIIITVADDFFDTKGSLHELIILTIAVQRWDSTGLNGHSKTIFDALYNHVGDMADKHLQQQGHDITNDLRNIWYETFNSWLNEAKWRKNNYTPSMDEYLENGMVSVATHTMVLPASCFLKPTLSSFQLKPPQYQATTRLLMISARLVNDINSYQKELKEGTGTANSMLLYMKDNPDADIEESVAYVNNILDRKQKEFLEHVLKDGLTNMPKPYKDLHFSCFKVFHMFFSTGNRYDSDTELLADIAKAIFVPLDIPSPPSKPLFPLDGSEMNVKSEAN